MPVSTQAVGKTYTPVVYAVGREKIREYASAVGETDPLHHELAAARAAGYADLVAPPMFAVVYSAAALAAALFDPEVKLDFRLMVHGGQEFVWDAPVVAGDEITTEASVEQIEDRMGRGFYIFGTRSVNQRGETTCTGTWTNIVRGA